MSSTLQDYVASEVRAMMARRRMTQGALAAALGRSDAYASRRLNGDVAFNLAELEQVAQVLGVPVRKLMPYRDAA